MLGIVVWIILVILWVMLGSVNLFGKEPIGKIQYFVTWFVGLLGLIMCTLGIISGISG